MRQGIFDVIHIVPPAATWSRSRHSDIPGQRPLRSRLAPLGLPSLTPSENDKVDSGNRALEAVLWCAEQALCCKTKAVGLNIIFPEDLGGHQSEGPSSLWVLREIQLLEGIRDARRAAGYLCQFTRTDFKRPLGVFSTSRKLRARLSLGWPRLERIHDRLVYKGPLPKNCSCNHIHSPMIGTSSDDVFCSSSSHSFTSDFWKHFVADHPLDAELSSLRDEGLPTDLAPLHSVGLSPLLSPSLASGIGSLRYVYEAWKAGNLARATLRDIASTDSCNTFFSTPPSYSLESLLQDQTLYRSLWTLSGRRLLCHCRLHEKCHGDVLIQEFSNSYPQAYDRTAKAGNPADSRVLNYMSRLREEPDSEEGSEPR